MTKRVLLALLATLWGGAAEAEPLKITVRPNLQPEDRLAHVTKSLRCLRDALYLEARGEPLEGQRMVVFVILARTLEQRRQWGYTICEVVYQVYARKRRLVSQFSGPIHEQRQLPMEDDPVLKRMLHVAAEVLAEEWVVPAHLQCVRFFQNAAHAQASRSVWFKTLRHAARIGRHDFYCARPSKQRTAAR